MTISEDKRTGVYKAIIKASTGKRHIISTKTKNLRDARKMARDAKLAELEQHAQTGQLTNTAVALLVSGKKVTMTKAIAAWADWKLNIGRSDFTVESQRILLEAWVRKANLADLYPSAITERHVSDFINDTREAVTAGTRRIRLSALRSLMDFCSIKGWSLGNVGRLVHLQLKGLSHKQKEPKVVAGFTDEEIDTLLAATEPGSFWHTATAIGQFAGLRLGDIAALEWACVGPDRMTVWTDKRDRRVTIPLLDDRLKRALLAVPPNGQRRMFPEQAAIAADPKRRSLLSTQFKRLCVAHGIEGKSFHGTRHSFLTNLVVELLLSGLTREQALKQAGNMAGHVSIETTEGYLIKASSDLE